MEKAIKLNEKVLNDSYPVNGEYLYVCDGTVVRCDIFRGTVLDLKKDLRSHFNMKAIEIKSCDIEGRRKLLNINND